jgi:hypothetical protein
MIMKKNKVVFRKIIVSLIFVSVFLVGINKTSAEENYSHIITLSPGWNVFSTPRLVLSHSFSEVESSENFDIYLLDSDSLSGWSTMEDLGQTEFTPLYGYFLNNKTGIEQTLTLNYIQDVDPNERFFDRQLKQGWNVIGVANPTYSLKQKDLNDKDEDNISNILSGLSDCVLSVLDFTADQTEKYSAKVGEAWSQKVWSDVNQLNDFRETKAYAIYLNNSCSYYGFQNNDEIKIEEEVSLNDSLTIEIDGPASYNVVPDINDAVIANLTFTTGGDEALEVKTLYGYLKGTDNGAVSADLETDLEHIQLVNVDTGDYYDVIADDTTTDDNYHFKVTNFTIPAGVSNWRVEADLVNTVVNAGDQFQFIMYAGADVDATYSDGSIGEGGKKGIEVEYQNTETLDNINPGAEINGNNVTVKIPTLTIANVTLANGDAVSKTKDVELLRFSATAGSSESIKMTQVALEATSSTAVLTDASNYTLKAEDGTVLQSGVYAVNASPNTITFNSLNNGGYIIPEGQTKIFIVTADINFTVTSSMISVMMATDGVTAEDSDGDILNATTGVIGDTNSVLGRDVTLRTKGTVTFTTASDSPSKQQILLSSQEDASILKFKADASYEDIVLKYLRFSISGTGSNATSSIDSLELWQDGEMIKEVATKNDSYGWVFTNLEAEDVIVAKDTDSIFELKMNVAGIGDGATDTASSGADITVTLLDDTTGVLARGYISNNDLGNSEITVTSVASQQNYVYATVVNAVDPGGQSSTLSSGEEEALRFKLTPSTNASKTAQLKEVRVNFSESGSVDVYGFKLYNGSGTEIASTIAGSVSTGTIGTGTLTVTAGDDIAGAGEIYIVKVFTTGANADDKLNVSVDINGSGGGDDIIWNDGSDNTGDISWIYLPEGSTTTEIKNQLVY